MSKMNLRQFYKIFCKRCFEYFSFYPESITDIYLKKTSTAINKSPSIKVVEYLLA